MRGEAGGRGVGSAEVQGVMGPGGMIMFGDREGGEGVDRGVDLARGGVGKRYFEERTKCLTQ